MNHTHCIISKLQNVLKLYFLLEGFVLDNEIIQIHLKIMYLTGHNTVITQVSFDAEINAL